MNRLIQDLLEVTSIESGQLAVELSPEAFEPLIDEAVAMLRPLATGRSIRLESDIAAGLPSVHLDSARILQVISNLVGNAIKFTPAHGRICIRCMHAEAEVRFSVTDTGAGIPAEQLPHIFGRFWQASATDKRGIGLGLSIAEGIVAAHRGRIWVESEEGVGSTFSFALPLALTV
jgi:signal transduction histidine kinase